MPKFNKTDACLAQYSAFIAYIEENFKDHSHLPIAKKVLACVDYISKHEVDIRDAAKQGKKLIRDDNNLAIHINQSDPDKLWNTFDYFIKETDGKLRTLLSIQDSVQKKAVINSFLYNINDDTQGCMEARLRNALDFVAIYDNQKGFNLDDIMAPLQGLMQTENINVQSVLSTFANAINYHLPIKISGKNGEEDTITTLSWEMVRNYINDSEILDDDVLDDDHWYQFSKDDQLKPFFAEYDKVFNNWVYTLYFEKKDNADLYLSYLKRMLLPSHQEKLAKIEIEENGSAYVLSIPPEIYRDFTNRLQFWEDQQELKAKEQASEPDQKLKSEVEPEEKLETELKLEEKLKSEFELKPESEIESESEFKSKYELTNNYGLHELPMDEDEHESEFESSGDCGFRKLPVDDDVLKLESKKLSEASTNDDHFSKVTINKQPITYQSKAEQIAHWFKTKGFWLKSFKDGAYNFVGSHVKGSTPGDGKIKQKPRPSAHLQYSILTDRIVDRQKEKATPYRYKGMTDEEIRIAKQKRSSPQSVTLGTPIAHPPVYRTNRYVTKLAGFIYAYKKIDENGEEVIDALVHSRFRRNMGTINRPLESNKLSKAKKIQNEHVITNQTYFRTNLEFEESVSDDVQNEAVVRLYFDPETDASGIFEDNLESRCLAVLNARVQQEELKKKVPDLDPDYNVPIIYYLPRKPKNFTVYTEDMLEKDIVEANSIFRDHTLRDAVLKKEDFEFLILVNDEHNEIQKIVMPEGAPYEGEPLLQALLYSGQLTILNDLFMRAKTINSKLTFEDYINIKDSPDNTKIKNDNRIDDGDTLVHLASRLGYVEITKYLINKNPDLSKCLNNKNYTPLMLAVINGHTELVNELLKMTKMEEVDNDAKLKLFDLAIQYGQREIASNILAHINIDTSILYTYLTKILKNPLDKKVYLCLEILVDYFRDRNELNTESKKLTDSVLQVMKWGHFGAAVNIFNKLLNAEAVNFEKCKSEIQQILEIAIRKGQVNLVKNIDRLTSYEINIESSLKLAVMYGQVDIIHYLLDRYLRQEIDQPEENSCLQAVLAFAVKKGDQNLLAKLDPLIKINDSEVDRYDYTLLDYAKKMGHSHIVKQYEVRLDELLPTDHSTEISAPVDQPKINSIRDIALGGKLTNKNYVQLKNKILNKSTVQISNPPEKLQSYIDDHLFKMKFYMATKKPTSSNKGSAVSWLSFTLGLSLTLISIPFILTALILGGPIGVILSGVVGVFSVLLFSPYIGISLFSKRIVKPATNKILNNYFKHNCEKVGELISTNHDHVKEWDLSGFFPPRFNISDEIIAKGLKKFLRALRLNPIVTQFILDDHITKNSNPVIVKLVNKIQQEVEKNKKHEKTNEEMHWHFVRGQLKKTVKDEIKRLENIKVFGQDVRDEKLQHLALFKGSIKSKNYHHHDVRNLVDSVNQWISDKETIRIMNKNRGILGLSVTSSTFANKLTAITGEKNLPRILMPQVKK